MHPVYTYIRQRLQESGYPADEASAQAKEVLTSLFGFSPMQLYAGKDSDFPSNERERLEDILERLSRHEPVQYIVGEVCFCGKPFRVTPDVLIPRPETAELIDWIVADTYGQSGLSVLDVGTGSGCIPVLLALRMQEAQVHSWDVSSRALAVAADNAALNGVNVCFREQDIFKPLPDEARFDIIVSNPPYITHSEKQEMETNVLEWEPGLALFVPDEDPLLFYRRIAQCGLDLLVPGGRLYFEINRAYGKETVTLLESLGYTEVCLRKDVYGNDRMVKARRE